MFVFSNVCFCGRYLVWNFMEYYCIWFQFRFSGVPDLMTTMKLMTIMIIIILTVTMKPYCEQHWRVVTCLNAESQRKRSRDWTHKDWGSKKDFSPAEWTLLLLWRTLLSCRGWSPRGPLGQLSSDDNTCPYYVYITLMLTCNLKCSSCMTTQPLCVYRSSDVWICTVHASVCVLVSAKKSICRQAKAKRACTLQQLHRTHTLNTHTKTNSSHCSPFFTLSWALLVTPHGDFALCQLSYSNKSPRHWPPRLSLLTTVWLTSIVDLIDLFIILAYLKKHILILCDLFN